MIKTTIEEIAVTIPLMLGVISFMLIGIVVTLQQIRDELKRKNNG